MKLPELPADEFALEIGDRVESEWGMGGLSGKGCLYMDFAIEVAKAYALSYGAAVREECAKAVEGCGRSLALFATVAEYHAFGEAVEACAAAIREEGD